MLLENVMKKDNEKKNFFRQVKKDDSLTDLVNQLSSVVDGVKSDASGGTKNFADLDLSSLDDWDVL